MTLRSFFLLHIFIVLLLSTFVGFCAKDSVCYIECGALGNHIPFSLESVVAAVEELCLF